MTIPLPAGLLPVEVEALADLAKRRGLAIGQLVQSLTIEAGEKAPTASLLRIALLADLKQNLPQGGLQENGSAPAPYALEAALEAVRKAK